MTDAAVRAALAALSARYELPPDAVTKFETLLDLVSREPASITSVRDPHEAVDLHVADSLSGLSLEVVRQARRVADLGSGAGFPGLALAIAQPDANIALVESVARKGRFLREAVGRLGLGNTLVVIDRAEAWSSGRDVHDLVSARALAPLTVLLEYAAPLLAPGGALVAWKGSRHILEEADGRAAADTLNMSAPEPHSVTPFAGARARTLYVSIKVGSTPNRYPRRPGMARKRPLGAREGGESSSPANL